MNPMDQLKGNSKELFFLVGSNEVLWSFHAYSYSHVLVSSILHFIDAIGKGC